MSFHRVAGFLLFVIIMIAGALPAWGQMRTDTRTFGVAGVVSDDNDEHRLNEVRVELRDQTADTLSITMSDGNGRFELNGIPVGNYVLHLTSPGYQSVDEPITLLNSTMHGLTFALHKAEGAAVTKSNSAVSAHELRVPSKAHDEYDKGIDLMYSKSDYQGAIAQFQRAIKDYPTFYEAYAKQGTAYVALRQFPEAEKSFRTSVELSADKYPEALFLLAGLLNNTNRAAEAEPLCRKGIAVDGTSALGHFELARTLAALNQPDEAEKNMLQARDLMPRNAEVYLFLTNIHIQKHDYPAALNDIGDFLKLDPSSPNADQARKTQASLQAAVGNNPPPPQSAASQPATRPQPKAKKPPKPDDQDAYDPGDDGAPSMMSPPVLDQ